MDTEKLAARVAELERLRTLYDATTMALQEMLVHVVARHPAANEVLAAFESRNEVFMALALPSQVPTDAWLHARQMADTALVQQILAARAGLRTPRP